MQRYACNIPAVLTIHVRVGGKLPQVRCAPAYGALHDVDASISKKVELLMGSHA